MVVKIWRKLPSGRSCRNSNTAVSLSIKVFFVNKRRKVSRQRRRKANRLSVSYNELGSAVVSMNGFYCLGVIFCLSQNCIRNDNFALTG